jgi:cobalt-zinc-cadmium efflux system outer membrane protein
MDLPHASRGGPVRAGEGWVPEVHAGVSAERDVESGANWSVGPAVSIVVPIFYQGQGEARVALAEMRQVQHRYADAAVRIRAAARAAASRLEAASKNRINYKDVLLPLRQQILDETQLQFNAMIVGVFQLLQAKRDQIETARGYVEALREYWIARAEVDQLLAGRLPAEAGSAEASDTGAPPAAARSATE